MSDFRPLWPPHPPNTLTPKIVNHEPGIQFNTRKGYDLLQRIFFNINNLRRYLATNLYEEAVFEREMWKLCEKHESKNSRENYCGYHSNPLQL